MCLESYDDDDSGGGVMKNYEERLLSFLNWPSLKVTHCAVNVKELAKAGFYYTGVKDICKCAYCNIEIYKWQPNDQPIVEHYKFARNCTFANILYHQHLNKRFSGKIISIKLLILFSTLSVVYMFWK